MKFIPTAAKLLLIATLFTVIPSAVQAATFTVNSTEDTDDGTCIHPYIDDASDCTMREAMQAAFDSGTADEINFDISTANFADDGDEQFTINVGSQLPNVNNTLTVTATSMWDEAGATVNRPGIRLIGNSSYSAFVINNMGGVHSPYIVQK